MFLAAKRYSSAFFKETYELGGKNLVLEDMKNLALIFDSNKDLVRYLFNRYTDSKKKRDFLLSLFGEKIQEQTKTFFEFLHFKKRLNLIPEIVRHYLKLDEEAQGMHSLILYFPKEDKELEKSLVNMLGKKMSCRFKVSTEYDTSLIGGFKYKIGDWVYDCSISGKLKRLKKNLETY